MEIALPVDVRLPPPQHYRAKLFSLVLTVSCCCWLHSSESLPWSLLDSHFVPTQKYVGLAEVIVVGLNLGLL